MTPESAAFVLTAETLQPGSETAIGIALVLTFSALLTGALGYLLRYEHQYTLLSGVDGDDLADPERLAEAVGGGVLVLAALTLGVALVPLVATTGRAFWLGFAVVSTVVAGWMVWRVWRAPRR